MDFEGLAYLTWREALLALVVALVLYLVVVFLRYRRVRHEKAADGARVPLGTRSALAAYAAEQSPPPAAEPMIPVAEAPAAPASAESFAWNEPPAPTPEPIAELQYDLAQLRREVGTLRAEVEQLRDARRREETKTQVSEKVSPVYSDAMQMAMDGHEAAAISLHCGISRAEAELVVALVRNRDNP